jgi:Zn-dependent M28 family amino/carboxypeptidase
LRFVYLNFLCGESSFSLFGEIMKLFSRSHSRRAWLALLLAYVLFVSAALGQQGTAVAPQTASTLTTAERETVAHLKVETLREVTTALADPAMEGRGTGQPGGEKAAKYIADKFAKLGLKPLGDAGSYLQTVKFRSTQLLSDSSAKVGDSALKFGEEFVPTPPFSAEKLSASGGVVFVGFGVTSANLKRDDLAGIDVKGKIVVTLRGRPKNVEEAVWTEEANPQTIGLNLIQRGAAAIVVANAGTQARPFAAITRYATFRRVTMTDAPETPFKLPPIILVSDAAAEKFFNGSGMTYAQTLAKAEAGENVSRDLNKTATIDVLVKREQVAGSNVAGFIEGSDAKLKSEAVIYTAHYDAFGVDSSGRIYPGAADNALGVGEIVAIAEAFAKAPVKPRRSIIFLAVTGEEYGLLGAEHWVKNPTWPIEKLAADLNFDGIGTEIYAPVKRIVGFGAEHSDLGETLKGVLASTDMILTPDPLPREQVFYRSDHYAFVKKGVPALMFLGGPETDASIWMARAMKWMATDYHQPGDTVRPDWHWDGARTVALVGLVTGMRVANADTTPRWLPSSPFNRARGTGEPPPSEKN